MYYFLIFSVILATANSLLLKKASLSGKCQVFFFNLIVSTSWFIILFALNAFTLSLNSEIVLWGVFYGITQTLFVLFKTLAMGSGPVSVTTLIGNFSLIVSTAFSIIVWSEPFSAFDLVGIIALLLSIFLCTYKKNNADYKKSWKYVTVFFFVFAACVGIVFKAFGKSSVRDSCADMMLVASIVIVLCYFILSLFTGGLNFKTISSGNINVFLFFALLCGICSCGYNRLNIYLAGKIDAVIFFPGFNGGVILLSALAGVLFFREKLSKMQTIGILLGAVAITLIGVL